MRGPDVDEEPRDVTHTVPVVTAQGRDAEFTAFVLRAEPLLARTAWLLTGDARRAEELVQATLVRTYVHWPRANDGDPLAYARRVLATQRIDSWRRRRREVLVAPSDVPQIVEEASEHRHAQRDHLVRALRVLPERRRRVIVLRYLLDLSEQQVAEDLGISVGTVKSAASRGLAQLRGVLDASESTLGEES